MQGCSTSCTWLGMLEFDIIKTSFLSMLTNAMITLAKIGLPIQIYMAI